MGRPHVCGDNPQALVSELSYIQVEKHCITILYHLHHQSVDKLHITRYFVLKLVRVV